MASYHVIVCDLTPLDLPALYRKRARDAKGVCFSEIAWQDELKQRGTPDVEQMPFADVLHLADSATVFFRIPVTDLEPDSIVYKELSVEVVTLGIH